jgi:hypothetical protein
MDIETKCSREWQGSALAQVLKFIFFPAITVVHPVHSKKKDEPSSARLFV